MNRKLTFITIVTIIISALYKYNRRHCWADRQTGIPHLTLQSTIVRSLTIPTASALTIAWTFLYLITTDSVQVLVRCFNRY